jgi:hypothetical protein
MCSPCTPESIAIHAHKNFSEALFFITIGSQSVRGYQREISEGKRRAMSGDQVILACPEGAL